MTSRERLIREIAYDLWEQEGRPEGHSERLWLAAEARFEAHRDVKDMMKSVHHVIDFTEVAHRRYWRDNGEQAPMPASGYEAAEHDGKSFVVVSNIDGPLAIYRIDFDKRDGLMAATDEEAAAVSKLLGYVQ